MTITRAQAVDYGYVPARQHAIDEQLKNWAAWSRSSGAGGASCLPMFAGYRDNYYQPSAGHAHAVDVLGALAVQRTLPHIPESHRVALAWCYIYPSGPAAICRRLGVSRQGLLELIELARDAVGKRLTLAESKNPAIYSAPS